MRNPASWQIVLGMCLCAWSMRAQAAEVSGEHVYRDQCARCHGPNGEGTEGNYPQPLTGDRSIAQLAEVIAESMPADSDEKCTTDEARQVAEHIYHAFYSPEAQFRNKPARVELSRLTVSQYQNTVMDLVGSFRPSSEPSKKRGLVGKYFAARMFRPDAIKLERTDSEVRFDFGVESPDNALFERDHFSIAWEGSVIAPDTGDYEFIVRTEHAMRLFVNDQTVPLIDSWVKSGADEEFRAVIRLIAGRAYSIRLEFSKATQGVGDERNQKKKKTKPSAKASIGLSWQRPHHTAEVIPTRFLSVKTGPELFVLQTPFPPDDRSTGFERGTTISEAWDFATTEAAIEVAGYVLEHLNELAGVADDAPDREARLIEFCHTFAERAFRSPLSEEQRVMYVDHQFAGAADPELAVKRVLLLVLKSPRFLYREVGRTESQNSYDVSARMSFALWDSLPDETLRRAAVYNQLATSDEVQRQLGRMMGDARTNAKLREFLLTWLKVSAPPEVNKDRGLYPKFTPETVSDLRTSLELSIDDALTSESADFRQLMLSESIFLNGNLAAVYGFELPRDARFTKVRYQPDHRSGLLSHPYLLACFAYADSSSPIHRGVFISRNLLGRTLRQPPEAVAPLPVELHAGLTTRERVTLQTEPQACQSCHSMINPLGFSLEQFDAIGRLRLTEKDRPVNDAGNYTTQSGRIVTFDGVPELAAFLASSEESQAAFVRQLFHHLVKQSIHAYGPNCWKDLRKRFAENDFNIHMLAAEIVKVSALPADTAEAPGAAPTAGPSDLTQRD